MNIKHVSLALFSLLLFLISCSIKQDTLQQSRNLDLVAGDAATKAEQLADFLAQAGGAAALTGDQAAAIDETAALADAGALEAADLLAETQPTDPAVYLAGIESGARCLPGETELRVLAKASPDEIFFDVGNPANTYNSCYPGPLPKDWPGTPGPGDTWVPKTNEAYVWGLTLSGCNLFFGTGPNIHCFVIQGLGYTDSIETGSYVCESAANLPDFSDPNAPYLLKSVADWRPPSFYMYKLPCTLDECMQTQCVEPAEQLVDIGAFPAMPAEAQALRSQTFGIRSAGAHRGVVFLAGPALTLPGVAALTPGINIFAFDACSGKFLGATKLDRYDNIRKWAVIEGELYAGVGSPEGGAVLKWRGKYSCDPSALFDFEVVGRRMDGDVAELCCHEGRIFATTWPMLKDKTTLVEAGLWMSPKLDPCLTREDRNDWEKVWSTYDYDPDGVTAATYGGGALASHDGWLYWGTMHVPLAATIAHFARYGEPEDYAEVAKALIGTWRAVAIFRGRNFDRTRWGREIDTRWGKRVDPRPPDDEEPAPAARCVPRWGKRPDPRCGRTIELLYGERFLPKYVPNKGWRLFPNNMEVRGMKPRYGHSGFGNLFNNYCWTMDVYRSRLYTGTMDWSYLLFDTLGLKYAGFDFSFLNALGIQGINFGADLYAIAGSTSAAEPVSLNGMGNPMNYGIRTMTPGSSLYLGTANPMNLHKHGGWELIALSAR